MIYFGGFLVLCAMGFVLILAGAAKRKDRAADQALGKGTLHENGVGPKDDDTKTWPAMPGRGEGA